jgi:hypothetical protein
VDDTVNNCVCFVGPLGMNHGSARKAHCCTGVLPVCAQRRAHLPAVTGVTGVWEVFWEKSISSGRESALGPLPDTSGEFLDVIEDLASLGHFGQDLALGVHDRGVITPEGLADLG